MAIDEDFAARIREAAGNRDGLTERKMFGGLCWMVNGNMGCGVMSDGALLVRLEAAEAETAWKEPNAGPFGREGAKPMTGFVRVDQEAVGDAAELSGWVDAGLNHAASLPPKRK